MKRYTKKPIGRGSKILIRKKDFYGKEGYNKGLLIPLLEWTIY